MKILGPNSRNAWRSSDGIIDLTRDATGKQCIEFPADMSPVRINLSATALIVVDMQNLFCAPSETDGQETNPDRQPIQPLAKLVPVLRDTGVPVVWLNWGNRPDEANLPPSVRYAFNRDRPDNPQAFLTRGTSEAEIVPELVPADGDIRIDKYRLSGFWDTPLDTILRGHRIDTILFAGVNVDQCVYHTLADAHFLGYDCILLSDCAATTSPAYCTEATIYNVKFCLGFVAMSSSVIEALATV